MLEREIKSLRPYVRILANRYKGFGVPVEDLEQEGILGIFKAHEHFDKKRKVKFSSYAIWWIRQSILNAVNTQSRLVHMPFGKINLFRKIKDLKDTYIKKYHREPSDVEIKQELQLEGNDYESAAFANSPVIHIHEEIDDDSKTTYEKFLAVEDNFEENINREFENKLLYKSLDLLDKRERYIIEKFFGLYGEPKLGLEEIGNELNLTRERCRQIKREALKKLKKEIQFFFD